MSSNILLCKWWNFSYPCHIIRSRSYRICSGWPIYSCGPGHFDTGVNCWYLRQQMCVYYWLIDKGLIFLSLEKRWNVNAVQTETFESTCASDYFLTIASHFIFCWRWQGNKLLFSSRSNKNTKFVWRSQTYFPQKKINQKWLLLVTSTENNHSKILRNVQHWCTHISISIRMCEAI